VGGAAGFSGPVALQVAAGNVDDCVTVEVTIVLPEDTIGQPFCVSQEPGGFVVPLGMVSFGGTDTEGHAEGTALRAEAGTEGWHGWHRTKIVGLAIPTGAVYLCELIHK
jgi:hypothetical protein